MIKKIYLHWTAGRYDQLFNDYHICIDGDGGVHRMGEFSEKKAHTWKRNSNAVGIALCCCYGASISRTREHHSPVVNKDDNKDGCCNEPRIVNFSHITWGAFPPTEIQIVSMAKCVAEICQEYGLPISKDTVMTHAEVADMDGYGVYDEDPDLRWDLLRLPGHSYAVGGDVIRNLAKKMLENIKKLKA